MKKIQLGGKYTHLFAMVDDEDYEWLNGYRWWFLNAGCGYAVGRIDSRTKLRMHRVIMNPPDGMQVDHIDGDGLNNQRSNLRLCTRAQNNMNQRIDPSRGSSRFKGVYLKHDQWMSRIQIDGRLIYLGLFDSEVSAAEEYDRAALALFGEFARLNFPGKKDEYVVDPGKYERTPGLRQNNKSGHSGILFYKRYQNWLVVLKVGNKRHHVGYFPTLKEAVVAKESFLANHAEINPSTHS